MIPRACRPLGLADDLRRVGGAVRAEAARELADRVRVEDHPP